MAYVVIRSGPVLIGVRPVSSDAELAELRSMLPPAVTIDRPGGPMPDLRSAVWDPASRSFVSPPTAIPRRVFLARFTQSEAAAIRAAGHANQAVDYLWQKFLLSAHIDVGDPEVIRGVQLLERVGLIGRGRAAEVLAPQS